VEPKACQRIQLLGVNVLRVFAEASPALLGSNALSHASPSEAFALKSSKRDCDFLLLFARCLNLLRRAARRNFPARRVQMCARSNFRLHETVYSES
jgi:hypothetical protein